jgi:hypothetical protein
MGGMKPESEIGVALRAGHPVYFIGFLPKPEPGHTIEDVCLAEGTFIEDVAQRHAEAASKPIVIANCQAGWQTMMMAAIRPDLTGPIILAAHRCPTRPALGARTPCATSVDCSAEHG